MNMSTNLTLNVRHWLPSAHRFSHYVTARCAYSLSQAEASGSSQKHIHNPLPYPTHHSPTPHQIFHLPRSATETEIKARYYELVRLYHPDKSGVNLSPDIAHSRFQAITTAYDTLRGKTLAGGFGTTSTGGSEVRPQSTAAYRTMQRKRQELYNRGPIDEAKMDKWLIAGVVGTIIFVVMHTATTRREALAEAMSRSRSLAAQSQSQRTQEAEERLSLDASRSDRP